MPYKVLCILRTCCCCAPDSLFVGTEDKRLNLGQAPKRSIWGRWVVKTFDSIRPIDCISIKIALIRLSQALNASQRFCQFGGGHNEVTLPIARFSFSIFHFPFSICPFSWKTNRNPLKFVQFLRIYLRRLSCCSSLESCALRNFSI